MPSLTELLFDLGLDTQIVGRTGFCIHPKAAVRKVPKVGGTKDIKLERIISLKPTHVIVNVDENRREDADALRDAGIAVVVTHPMEPADNLALYTLAGRLFGVEQRAAELCDALRAALADISSHDMKLGVLYLIWRRPWMTISADTYLARMLALAGLEPVAVDTDARYPQVEDDDPAWQRADAVLLSSEPFPFRAKHIPEVASMRGRSVDRVMCVDGELLSWYGSRAVGGVRYAKALGDRLRASVAGATGQRDR